MILLQKDPCRDFTVLNLTDPQLDASYLGQTSPDWQLLSKTIDSVIQKASPDLITISGDLGYGDDPTYPATCKQFADFIEKHKIPWAVVWGNHDNQGGSDVIKKTVQLFQQYPHFVYESGDEQLGNGNYLIRIQENNSTIAGIIMMDTHNRFPYTDTSGNTIAAWGKLLPNQLEWYQEQIQTLQNLNCMHSLLITHIPIYTYRQAFDAAFRAGIDPKSISLKDSYSKFCWRPEYESSFGVRYEKECCYPADEGAFKLIQSLNNTKVILCGHDHVNCWCVNYHGIKLTYSLKTGQGCYHHKDLNGGTIVKIHSDGTMDVEHIFADVCG